MSNSMNNNAEETIISSNKLQLVVMMEGQADVIQDHQNLQEQDGKSVDAINSKDQEEYDRYMANLTPCSSIFTRCSDDDNTPMEYNPIDIINLLNKRNSLSKSGTLIDNTVRPKTSRGSTSSGTQFEMDLDDLLVKIFISNSNDEVTTVKLQELLQFINSNQLLKHITIHDLTIVHLLIYLSHIYSTPVNKLKLYHLGKLSHVSTMGQLTIKTTLIEDLKINRFPTMHLMIPQEGSDSCPEDGPGLTSDLNAMFDTLSVRDSIEKSFGQNSSCSVSYSDVLMHKISGQNLKTRLKTRFNTKVKTKFKNLLHI